MALVAIASLVWQVHSSRSEERVLETQIAKQDVQIALIAEQNRLLSEQATVAAQRISINEQLCTPFPTNDANFAPTATALAIQSIQIEATAEAIEAKQTQIAATNVFELLDEDTFDGSSKWNVEKGMKIENGVLVVYPGYDAVPRHLGPYNDFEFESEFYIFGIRKYGFLSTPPAPTLCRLELQYTSSLIL